MTSSDTPSPMQTTPSPPARQSDLEPVNFTDLFETDIQHDMQASEHPTGHSHSPFPDLNPFQLSEEQLTFLDGEFDDSTTSSDHFLNFLPQNTALTNLLVTMHDEENPLQFTATLFHEPV